MRARTYYEILGVEKNATTEEIKKAYRKLVVIKHPDKRLGEGEATKQFIELETAYRVLTDNEDRAHYDKSRDDPVEVERERQRQRQERDRLFKNSVYKSMNRPFQKFLKSLKNDYPTDPAIQALITIIFGTKSVIKNIVECYIEESKVLNKKAWENINYFPPIILYELLNKFCLEFIFKKEERKALRILRTEAFRIFIENSPFAPTKGLSMIKQLEYEVNFIDFSFSLTYQSVIATAIREKLNTPEIHNNLRQLFVNGKFNFNQVKGVVDRWINIENIDLSFFNAFDIFSDLNGLSEIDSIDLLERAFKFQKTLLQYRQHLKEDRDSISKALLAKLKDPAIVANLRRLYVTERIGDLKFHQIIEILKQTQDVAYVETLNVLQHFDIYVDKDAVEMLNKYISFSVKMREFCEKLQQQHNAQINLGNSEKTVESEFLKYFKDPIKNPNDPVVLNLFYLYSFGHFDFTDLTKLYENLFKVNQDEPELTWKEKLERTNILWMLQDEDYISQLRTEKVSPIQDIRNFLEKEESKFFVDRGFSISEKFCAYVFAKTFPKVTEKENRQSISYFPSLDSLSTFKTQKLHEIFSNHKESVERNQSSVRDRYKEQRVRSKSGARGKFETIVGMFDLESQGMFDVFKKDIIPAFEDKIKESQEKIAQLQKLTPLNGAKITPQITVEQRKLNIAEHAINRFKEEIPIWCQEAYDKDDITSFRVGDYCFFKNGREGLIATPERPVFLGEHFGYRVLKIISEAREKEERLPWLERRHNPKTDRLRYAVGLFLGVLSCSLIVTAFVPFTNVFRQTFFGTRTGAKFSKCADSLKSELKSTPAPAA